MTQPVSDPHRLHTCAKHEPGERACYHRCGCRCDPCKAANSRYAKAHKLGVRSRVPAELVRAHIDLLIGRGMTQAQICEASGVGTGTMCRITHGVHDTVSRHLAAAILAVQPQRIEKVRAGWVDACGTRLRLHALSAIGWTWTAIAAEMGVHQESVQRWSTAHTVNASSRAAVIAAYERLWNQPQGDVRALASARKNGWLPPMGLDDDRIDDPTYRPRRPKPTLNREARLTEVRHLLDLGESAHHIATRLDMTPDALDHLLSRWAPDLAPEFRRLARQEKRAA